MKRLLPMALLAGSLVAGPAVAEQLKVTMDIPAIQTAEYHRPYVAAWLQHESGDITNLLVWYDTKLRNNEGEKWLKDMRQWWRRTGRALSFPVDGVTGATRAPGTHSVRFVVGENPLGNLTAGSYTLIVEAAREVGGREMVAVPFTWPSNPGATFSATGSEELGVVTLEITE